MKPQLTASPSLTGCVNTGFCACAAIHPWGDSATWLLAPYRPLTLPLQEIAVTLVCGMAALLRLPPNRSDVIPRQRCLLLFSIYGIFIWAALAAGRYPPN